MWGVIRPGLFGQEHTMGPECHFVEYPTMVRAERRQSEREPSPAFSIRW
jgi:hypothetical protein